MSPRPLTLRQIAERADSLDEFGRHFRDWLHELRHFSSRDKVVAAVTDEPGRLVKNSPRAAWPTLGWRPTQNISLTVFVDLCRLGL